MQLVGVEASLYLNVEAGSGEIQARGIGATGKLYIRSPVLDRGSLYIISSKLRFNYDLWGINLIFPDANAMLLSCLNPIYALLVNRNHN